jgi:Asp-tRNA(Asn)/Glu-tRNA(Gln) amidotransferase A subunit family amidase
MDPNPPTDPPPVTPASLASAQPGRALRGLEWPLHLQPAIHFDPRIPGHSYPPQKNVVRLGASTNSELPEDDAAIAYASVVQLSRWLQLRRLSCTRLTEIYLDRIARIAPKLYCYITVCADLARNYARQMDDELRAGHSRGALHGIPYSLKDVFDTAGIPTTWGSALYRDRIPTEDATVVRMLREAGAILLGKVAMGELANGWTWFGGDCRNPWNTEEPSGGSSGGSAAATAAGSCAFSIGSDSLGSIINPADRCGIVGLRPTFGRVPVKGAMPLTPSLERIGPLCRSVEDAALVLSVINGYDPTSASSIDWGFTYDGTVKPDTIRVGYSPKWFDQIGFDPAHSAPVSSAEHAALQALRELRVQLIPVELPVLPYGALIENLYVEAAAVFDELTLSGRDAQLTNQDAWPPAWRRARLLSAVDYLQTERFRRHVMQQMHELFNGVDLLFGPTYGSFELLYVMNFTGHPGLTLRAGFHETPTRNRTVEGFFTPSDPGGARHTTTRNVTFHGRLFEEGKMLALAAALERRLGVWDRPPNH